MSYMNYYGKDATQTGVYVVYNNIINRVFAVPQCHPGWVVMPVGGRSTLFTCRECNAQYDCPAAATMAWKTSWEIVDSNDTSMLQAWIADFLGVPVDDVEVTIE